MQLWHYFQAGGMVMWALLACSLFAVAIGIQRIRFFSQTGFNPEDERNMTVFLQKKEWEKARKLATDQENFMSQLLVRTIEKSDVRERELTFENGATTLIHRMQEGLRNLDMIVTLSPLLGLLGTVLGMIQSFQVLDVKEGNMDAITGGVAEALVATAFGLIVAVLALCIHSYLTYRLDKAVTTLEEWGGFFQD